MNEYSPNFYVNGTSALKVQSRPSTHGITFTAFKGGRRNRDNVIPASAASAQSKQTVRSFLQSALYASEMYCSLLFEDFRGCSYKVFTHAGIATLSAVSALVAIVALAFGA